MIVVKVLGPGCGKCGKTVELINKTAEDLGLELSLEKESDIATIMGYGVMSTPGVVINEKVVHSGGGIPSLAKVREWLTAAQP